MSGKRWVVALGLALVGCAAPEIVRINYVQTSTPGVKYVIVRPGFKSDKRVPRVAGPDGSLVTGDAEYVLVCDARGTGPMKCGIPPEVGTKASLGETVDKGPLVEGDVGIFGTKVTIEHLAASAEVQAVAAPVPPPPPATAPAPTTAPPPPPAPTTAPAPEKTPEKTPATKEKKK